MIRIPVYVFLVILFLWKCAPQENKTSEQTNPDSSSIRSNTDKIESIATIAPLDTIVASYPNGQKLHLYIFAYHDSLPGRPIKDFEVRDVEKNETVFRSVTERLELGYETDPMKGEYDSMLVVPAYLISSKDPLKVELDFIVHGERWVKYLGDLTYPFYESRPWNRLSFIYYSFQLVGNKYIVKSWLRFTPHKCEMDQEELTLAFNRIKTKKHFYTDEGTDLMKQAFNCFLNERNSNYSKMISEFKVAMAPTPNDPYTYFPYINYLDMFISSLTSKKL